MTSRILLALTLGLFVAAGPALPKAAAPLTLGTAGDRFTVNGTPRFLVLTSYFDALDAVALDAALDAAYRSSARYWVEAFRAADICDTDIAARVTTSGMDLLDAVLDEGNGAIVLHRSVVGTGAVVAANSVVLYDVDIPPGALAVGALGAVGAAVTARLVAARAGGPADRPGAGATGRGPG